MKLYVGDSLESVVSTMKQKRLSLLAVVPRFGASIGGGAETLIRELFLNLKEDNFDLEIVTTCAMNHRTWDNELPEGLTVEEGLKVRRFPVDMRDLDVFIKAEQKLHHGFSLSPDEQIAWLENSVNSSGLYQYLFDNKDSYDFIFFAPYLFGTSFWGPLICPEKAILVPCLHDEAYAYLPVFRNVFRKVRGIMWNAAPEAELADAIYSIPDLKEKGVEVGMGFDFSENINQDTLKHDITRPYLLYSGRKETGKNLDYLISCYEEYRLSSKAPFDLVLIGSGSIDFLSELPPGVIDLGFVSEGEKRLLLKNARLFIQPSTNESFSIVLMEAWREGTPVLVHSDCAVTFHHVERSGGGMSFRSKNEFIENVQRIETEPSLRDTLGAKGKEFVMREYSWEAVKERFFKGLEVWSSQVMAQVIGN